MKGKVEKKAESLLEDPSLLFKIRKVILNSRGRPRFPPLEERVESECNLCGSDNNLEKHHIVPKSKGGSNKPRNLVKLCRNCHQQIHKEGVVSPVESVVRDLFRKLAKKYGDQELGDILVSGLIEGSEGDHGL